MKGIRTYMAALVGLVGLVGTAGAVPTPFFDTVVSFTPGTHSGVLDTHAPISSYTGPSGPGTFDPAAVTILDGVNLVLAGPIPGSIVLGFSDGREFVNGRGPDVHLYSDRTHDWVRVEFSYDGATFFHGQPDGWVSSPLGNGRGDVFLRVSMEPTGLASARFLRLTSIPFPWYPSYPGFVGYPEGYHLDAAEALYIKGSEKGAEPLPEPSTWVLLSTGLLGLLGYGWRQRRPTP